MKLSMHIFAEELKAYHPQANIQSNLFEIETVRLFSPEVTLEKNTMYIGRLSDLFRNGSDRVICTHNNDMLLLDTADMESVLNSVLNTLSFYNAWDNTMLNLLTREAMLQDLFDVSGEVLRRPVFLLDAGQRLLAYSQAYRFTHVDELWDSIMQEGSSPIHFLIRFNQQAPERTRSRGVFSYHRDFFPTPSRHYNFFQQDHFLGSATIIAKGEPLSQAEEDCFAIFCSYIERWFHSHIQEQQSLLLDYQLRTAILNPDADNSELRRGLLLLDWKDTDSLLFFKLDAPFKPFNINTHLCHTLNISFSNIVAVTVEVSGCMLCNLSRTPLLDIERQLIPILQNSHYYATMGEPFHMTDCWYEQYRYLQITSGFVSKKSGMIYQGRQFTLPYLLSEMQHTILPDILHPAVGLLADYDKIHNTEFYKTLYVYIKNGRSLIDTVKEMHLHRNTLLYRLKRIQELIDCDLEDASARLHLWLSFEIYGNGKISDTSKNL